MNVYETWFVNYDPLVQWNFRKELFQRTLFVYFLTAPDKWKYYKLDHDISRLQYFQFTFLSTCSYMSYNLVNVTTRK
jgi:hypothetical protein